MKLNSGVAVSNPKGFSLLEVLIALLVLSIGLLGTAAMQIKSVQSTHLAYQRTIANLAAYDAMERVWREVYLEGGCPSGSELDQVSSVWVSVWSSHLPLVTSSGVFSEAGACSFSINVEWEDGRFSNENSSTLEYTFKVPGE